MLIITCQVTRNHDFEHPDDLQHIFIVSRMLSECLSEHSDGLEHYVRPDTACAGTQRAIALVRKGLSDKPLAELGGPSG